MMVLLTIRESSCYVCQLLLPGPISIQAGNSTNLLALARTNLPDYMNAPSKVHINQRNILAGKPKKKIVHSEIKTFYVGPSMVGYYHIRHTCTTLADRLLAQLVRHLPFNTSN